MRYHVVWGGKAEERMRDFSGIVLWSCSQEEASGKVVFLRGTRRNGGDISCSCVSGGYGMGVNASQKPQ